MGAVGTTHVLLQRMKKVHVIAGLGSLQPPPPPSPPSQPHAHPPQSDSLEDKLMTVPSGKHEPPTTLNAGPDFCGRL